jgi:hypothetical protein
MATFITISVTTIIRKPQLSTYNLNGREKKNCPRIPDGGLTLGLTGRLTMSGKINLTLNGHIVFSIWRQGIVSKSR